MSLSDYDKDILAAGEKLRREVVSDTLKVRKDGLRKEIEEIDARLAELAEPAEEAPKAPAKKPPRKAADAD